MLSGRASVSAAKPMVWNRAYSWHTLLVRFAVVSRSCVHESAWVDAGKKWLKLVEGAKAKFVRWWTVQSNTRRHVPLRN